MYNPDPVRHIRPVPAEWLELAAHAESIIPEDTPPNENSKRRHLFSLFKHALELPTERLETTFYYGLGEVACSMARLLQYEEIREWTIKESAKEIVQRRRDSLPPDKPFVPTIGDLLEFTGQPFLRVAQAAWREMPAPRRALTDVLTIAAVQRRYQVHDRLKIPRWLASGLSIEAARDLRPAAQHIGQNSTAASTSVLGMLLTGTNLAEHYPKELLARPISLSKLEEVRNSRIFIGATRVREDEFRCGVGLRGDGESLHFDADILAKLPPPLKSVSNPGHAHEGRLTCPAALAGLHGGLAFYMASNILPSIIVATSHIVPQNLP